MIASFNSKNRTVTDEHLIAGFNHRDEMEYLRLCSRHPMKADAEAWLAREGLFI